MRKQLHGVQLPHLKATAEMPAVTLKIPESVVIPMSMHIGAPAKPVVKVKDTVKVGQPVAEAGGYVSAPIHSSVSGTVVKIDEMMGANGRRMQTIQIETDGLQTPYEGIEPPRLETQQDFFDALRLSGLVGLGGAGFPTAVKLMVKDIERIKAVIVNGAECEPYITSDTRTMLERADAVIAGARVLQKFLKPPRVIFAIEGNKPKCVKLYRELTAREEGMEVMELKSMYPQGGEKVLIYHTIGAVVPEGKLPIDVGAIVINCTTLADIAQFCETGMPLVRKCVTVSGPAVKHPQNVIAPVGMRLKDVFEACGGFTEEPRKVLYGGPMMGIAVPDLEQPVLKTTNAVLAFGEKDAEPMPTTACIRCGTCIAHCPMGLMPLEMETAYRLKRDELLNELKVNLCIECGCCSYGCPANRPLTQTNKLAKARLNAWKAARKEAQK